MTASFWIKCCCWFAVVLFGFLSIGIVAFAEEPTGEEVDHVALAALLIRDELYDRARTILAQVDETQEGIDLARLYTLRGLVELHAGDLTAAKDAFRKALGCGPEQPFHPRLSCSGVLHAERVQRYVEGG